MKGTRFRAIAAGFAALVLVACEPPAQEPASEPVLSLSAVRERAEQGDASAQFYLGVMYAGGVGGVPQDHIEAVRWLQLAAAQGNASAQLTLGQMYRDGEGVPEDDVEAIRLFGCVVEAESGGVTVEALVALGEMYRNGEGVPKDDAEAATLFRRAVEYGDAHQERLVDQLAGIDVETVDYLRRTVEQRIAPAQFYLGVMYATGHGVPEDDAEAVHWYRLAAEQGFVEAQFNLGVMYARGQGVPEDDLEAIRWFRLAAEQGLAEAQFNLGAQYANSEGIPTNYELAHMWLNLAGANGYGEARDVRRKLEGVMSREQIATAQRRAATCLESGYQDC